jgi:metal-dependent amidase/aminoacylase/carboxypeptidase family protein
MVHPAGYTLASRPSLASYRLGLKFLGRAAHAAASPDEGVNALDALVQTFVAIGLLRQQVRDDARIHGIITYGGAAPNIIPDRAEATITVRAADSAYAEVLVERVIRCGAGAHGAQRLRCHEAQPHAGRSLRRAPGNSGVAPGSTP